MKDIKSESILVMKIGYHGAEDIDTIIARKKEEEKKCGQTYWGYGGVLCHPIRVVQNFASQVGTKKIKVLFSVTKSPFQSDPTRAKYFSEDGKTWSPLHDSANVLASKFAIVLRSLKACKKTIVLNDYCVPIGPSKGRPLNEYLRFRVDKAVGTLSNKKNLGPLKSLPIQFEADLVPPYAILVSHQHQPESHHPSQISLPY